MMAEGIGAAAAPVAHASAAISAQGARRGARGIFPSRKRVKVAGM